VNLRREFVNREDLFAYLRQQFPDASGSLSPFPGGRTAADAALQRLDVCHYAATRNYLNGKVSRLSPYLRHGVITLREVLAFVRERFTTSDTYKFVQELAWRDYWQQVYFEIGDGIWLDRERSKTGAVYSAALPDDLGRTGLACMDSFVHDLEETGYLHNHARMWLASYLIHWRRTVWQSGARWFLTHLVDGDPASNNLSWQWVASTFSVKPYIFNRENLERYTKGVYCERCTLRQNCPFDKSYEQLTGDLFSK
jgi:deoxyribodipyrimidine photo-lyase